MSETPLRLLLVEDSADDAALLLHVLRRERYQVQCRRVETAETFLEALGMDEWDLVISDYSLPQFSGPRALALFKERGIDIPFIVVSGAVGEDAAVALMKNGANDFVTKGNLDRVPPVVHRELADAAVRRRDRLAAAEKLELQAQLLQAQKMEAIGVLTAGVAHDFNNILGAIQIYTDLAQMKSAKGLAIDNELHQIIAATERAAGLARQLLLFSRKQPLELVPLDPVSIVENLLKMLRRIIGEHIEVRTEIEPSCRQILGDGGGLEQVIMNLAVNARDAMQGAGALTIGLGNVEVVDSYCRGLLGARPGPFVRLYVQDTGCGMDQETVQRIFEPFFTTKAAGKGTGLGLSVVYGIVKQHQGWITVRSSPGAGTRFEMFFPPAMAAGVTQAEQARRRSCRPRRAHPARGGRGELSHGGRRGAARQWVRSGDRIRRHGCRATGACGAGRVRSGLFGCRAGRRQRLRSGRSHPLHRAAAQGAVDQRLHRRILAYHAHSRRRHPVHRQTLFVAGAADRDRRTAATAAGWRSFQGAAASGTVNRNVLPGSL